MLAAAPADARPAGAQWPWVIAQTVQSNGKVSMTLEWKKIARSKKYRIDYAPLKGNLGSGEVQKSRHKKSKTVKGGGGKLKHGVVANLKPGKVYCFQVYGVSGKSTGNRGGVHCKMTTRADRRPVSSSYRMVVGTFNACSRACGGWSSGRDELAMRRIQEMRMGGYPVDVLAVQEATDATDTFDAKLVGFTHACETVEGADDDQSLFVRTSTYEPIAGTQGGISFPGHYGNGACWAQIRNIATQQTIVAASIHLSPGSSNSLRASQLTTVVGMINKQFGASSRRIYAGDFNSHASHTTRATDVPLGILWANGHYDDSYDMANAFLSKPYYNSGGAHSATPVTSWTWGDHIDRVFTPPGVHVASWKVDYRMSGGRYVQQVSDHNPVLVSLSIPR